MAVSITWATNATEQLPGGMRLLQAGMQLLLGGVVSRLTSDASGAIRKAKGGTVEVVDGGGLVGSLGHFC